MNLTTAQVPQDTQSAEWQTYSLFGLTLASDFPFSSRLTAGAGMPDLTFTCVLDAPLSACAACVRAPAESSPDQSPDSNSSFTLYHLSGGDLLRFTDVADFYLWPARIVCHLLDRASDYLVEIYLLGRVLAYWLERRGMAVLHASSVVLANRAIAFIASSMSGKTSLAATFMQAGYPLLTDDNLPICAQGNRFIAQPGYPQMRMWPEQAEHFLGHYQTLELVHPAYTKRRVPVEYLGTFCEQPQALAALYLPERRDPTEHGTTISIKPLSRAQALFTLISHSFATNFVNGMANQQQRMAFFTPLVQQVPVRRLLYPEGFEHLPRVRQAILSDLEALC